MSLTCVKYGTETDVVECGLGALHNAFGMAILLLVLIAIRS